MSRYAKLFATLPGVITVLITQFAGDTQVEKALSVALTIVSAVAVYLVPNAPASVPGAHEAPKDAGVIETSVVWLIVGILLIVVLAVWLLQRTGH